jgi:Uma2 family endonuclease
VVVRMSPAMPRHMRVQRQLFRDLDGIFGDGICGYVAAFEMTIRFAERTVRDLDVAIVRGLAEAETYLGPESILLATEVSSTTLRYDLDDKRVEYARGNIPHYWVVDVAGEAVHIFGDPIDGDYTSRRRAAFGEPLAVPGCDGTVTIR